MVVDILNKEKFSQFQVGYMFYPGWNKDKYFKDQVKKMRFTLNKLTMVPIRKFSKKYNTHVISLLMFYEDRDIMIIKVLCSVIYCIKDNYLYVNYMCLQRDKLYSEHEVLTKQNIQ